MVWQKIKFARILMTGTPVRSGDEVAIPSLMLGSFSESSYHQARRRNEVNKTNLMATSVIAALVVAAAGTSMAQQERGAPLATEKMAPSGAKPPSAARHQNGEAQNAPAGRNEKLDGRVGETPQSRGRIETTGQAP